MTIVRKCSLLMTTLAIFLVAGLPMAGAQNTLADAQSTRTEGSTPGLRAFENRLKMAYGNAAYLAFSVKYRYANERLPQAYLDSLSGEVQMDKGRSRTVIDGMETVITGRYAIQVMREEKMIYLAAAHPTNSANPLPMLDSVFAHIDGIKSTVEKVDGSDILTLDFPPGQAYTKMQMVIDDRTGYFQRVEYSLNTAGLVGQEMVERPGHPAPYQSRGRIEIVFTNYKQGHFDDRVFSEGNFFTRISGRYEPAGPYKDYHIYLASSNL